MTVTDFRKLALALPGAVESAHMNQLDLVRVALALAADTVARVKAKPKTRLK